MRALCNRPMPVWMVAFAWVGLGFLASERLGTAGPNEDYNESCVRAEIPPKAESDLDCPSNKITAHCSNEDCTEAEASGCGRSVRYRHRFFLWWRIGPAPAAPSPEKPAQGQPSPPADPAFGQAPVPQPASAPGSAPAEVPPTPSSASTVLAGLAPGAPQPTAYAIIIGIERYPSLPVPVGARTDAERFAQVARRTLGIPASQIRVLLDGDASRSRIEREMAWVTGNVPSGGRIYFYFSGHGAPDPGKGTSYLVPVDGDPQYLPNTSLTLDHVVQQLRTSKAKEVVMFTDACFSGAGGRSVLAPGARPIVRLKAVAIPGNVILFSASGGDEISGPTSDGKAGLFSSYLLQGLGNGRADLNGDGQISLKELIDYVGPRVSREAAKGNRAQHPAVKSGDRTSGAAQLMLVWGLEPT